MTKTERAATEDDWGGPYKNRFHGSNRIIPVEYRQLTTVAELEQVVEVEMAVWGLPPRDAVPVNIMRPMSAHGGHILGAFDGERMVGMSVAFPARYHGRWVLWSHMAAVLPELQGQGIGVGIKLAQRTWALEHGYDEIRWTFDPLQRGNANFNLHLLGATASIYHVNYYGMMEDAINRDSASDRIEASWKLRDRRVKAIAEGKPPKSIRSSQERVVILCDGASGPETMDIPAGAALLYAQVPRRSALSGDTLQAWRTALRQTLQTAFERGYVAVDVAEDDTTDSDASYYVLQAPTPWSLYVLECADGTLYTGISPNVHERLAKHQAGKGAAYTAPRRPVRLLGAWQFMNKSAALKAELAFKSLSRPAKLAALRRQQPFLEAPFVENP